jgi:hypothetical protein
LATVEKVPVIPTPPPQEFVIRLTLAEAKSLLYPLYTSTDRSHHSLNFSEDEKAVADSVYTQIKELVHPNG